ncbi:tetratricopeptide repeat protein [Shewanella nanhaiensis]|uniref:Tetratricopeptide repeat protein n=1 Tax=Shewanella nanhaiensis TaxID=2864872 RepID=A0ABS7E8N8_9GAMM|nr:tetratricopeptide repeat protein [Shewanella nanhaiensis]
MLRFSILIMLILSLELSASEKAQPKSNTSCISCHQQEAGHWQQSDHAKAMAIATEANVLGDFSSVDIQHYGQRAHFYHKSGKYFADISYDKTEKQPGKAKQSFEVKYSFGHYPLQQYLVETGKGKLQVLPFAWDSRPKTEGGQRWYHNYQNEAIAPNDRLHWRQPLQNWNGMCADCHSDGLKRHFSLSEQSFDTQWDNINVGCLSCHGDMSAHSQAQTIKSNNPSQLSLNTNPMHRDDKGVWKRKVEEKVATWHGEPRDNRFMETCFACHSLRSPLTDGIEAQEPFLDQFSPRFINAPSYYPDGQIKEEVYVYGSFMQSKMQAAGVNCLDCHDSHTMKLKAEGNNLCLQCHSPAHFNTKEHLHHKAGTAGSLCVDCHMPQTRYMGVDDRRDHSFSIPRPTLSEQTGSPNACNRCHQDKDPNWAAAQLKDWFGGEKQLASNQLALISLRAGEAISPIAHRKIIDDASIAAIKRASAIELLPMTHETVNVNWYQSQLTSSEPLIRLAAAEQGYLLPDNIRAQALSPLLNDPLRSVRIAAARTLSADTKLKATQELTFSNEVSSWRGEGRLNLALQHLALGQWEKAETQLIASIATDPYFDPSYINLADIYRASGQTSKASNTFKEGLLHNPNSSGLHYGLGLHLIRAKDYLAAEKYLENAATLAPQNVQYQYVYLVALDHNGKTTDALDYLKRYLSNYSAHPQLIDTGISFARKQGHLSMLNYLQQLKRSKG